MSPHRHGQPARTAVLLVNLGTPAAPTPAATRRYLAEFLADPRVVEIPRLVWLPLLHGVILRTRPRRSAAKYAGIWMPEGSPLAVWTERQARALHATMAQRGHEVLVAHAMRYGEPALPRQLDGLVQSGATRVLVLPLYPQYSAATTASSFDKVMQWAAKTRRVPALRFVDAFHDDAGYVEALAEDLQAHWRAHGRAERLLLSFHGMPARTLELGDPYFCHCQKTARLLIERLQLDPRQVQVTFQSRFGKARWLEPYTEPTLRQLATAGVKSVDVMCPGFVADCLETLEEIGIEARAAFSAAGGQDFRYVPCLNAGPRWISALAEITLRHLQGWPLAPAAGAALAPAADAAHAPQGER
ncbi:MAG: ferrochelatase [Burkholderiales bacterium]|nr:ferrochelatase [Burkholderiales bacterium]